MKERERALIRDGNNQHVCHPAGSPALASVVISLPCPDEISASFSQQPGQGDARNQLDLAGGIYLFSMPGLNTYLTDDEKEGVEGAMKGAGERGPGGARASGAGEDCGLSLGMLPGLEPRMVGALCL